jgi:eukaryotic-like serine/threonine-protein kinase
MAADLGRRVVSSGQTESLVGTVLQDSFELTRLIGQGGMGTVYEGTQLRLNKRVAVKLLSRQLTGNDEALARFRREAEVTSQLGHPHIVQVFDFGTAPSGEPYLVMEHLDGEDLDQRIRRAGRLRLADAVNIVKQIASALSATHARGIVHRDLKPANVFLLEAEGESDFVKIVDFGISKVRAASVRITGESVVMGTPNYMSPEQATGQIDGVDHKTDQWSLACIAYEMLSGRGPFVGDSIQSLLYQVVHEDPRALKDLVSGLPDEVANVIRRALSKKTADRFSTVNAFSRALVAASAGAASAAIAATAESGPAVVSASSAPGELPGPPRVTTLSRSASEMLPFARLRRRLTPRGIAAAGLTTVVVVVIGAFLMTHSRTGGHAPLAPPPPAAASELAPTATGRPAVDVVSMPPSSAAPLAPPTLEGGGTVEPNAAPKADLRAPQQSKHRRVRAAKSEVAPALPSSAVPPPRKDQPQPQAPQPAALKHHLIKEL